MNIIAIGGKQGSGKDLFTSIFVDREKGTDWIVLSSSDLIISLYSKRLKEAVSVDEIKKNKQKYREALQSFGDYLESRENAYIARAMILKALALDEKNVILNSVRRPSEFQYLKKLGAVFVYIDTFESNRASRIGNIKGDGHLTENFNFRNKSDFVISNNGSVDQFQDKICRMIKIYKKIYLKR